MSWKILLLMSSLHLNVESQHVMMNPEIYARNYIEKLNEELQVIYKSTVQKEISLTF